MKQMFLPVNDGTLKVIESPVPSVKDNTGVMPCETAVEIGVGLLGNICLCAFYAYGFDMMI